MDKEKNPDIKSNNTFQEEFDFLLNHVPGALDFQSEQTAAELIGDHFNNALGNRDNIPKIDTKIDTTTIQTVRLSDDFLVELLNANDYTTLGRIKYNLPSLTDNAFQSQLSPGLVQNLFLNFGSEAFGMYLPMHSFYKNRQNPWGIYLFPEVIGPHVQTLYEVFQGQISHINLLRFYIWCVYRHELFHFHTESFSTAQEVLGRKPLFLRYQKAIYKRHKFTEEWLEEALAEASVLESRLVGNRIDIKAALRKKIYKYDLRRMPDGYKHFECTLYGGPKEAHRHFAAQLLHLEEVNPLPTLMTTVKNEFIRKDINVPVYMVTGLRELKRIQ